MSEELRPCPFCGCNDERIGFWRGRDGFAVRCLVCGARMESWLTREELLLAWNRRSSPWRDFRKERPEDGQHCWFIDDLISEPEDAWYHADEEMFQAEPYEIIYPCNAKWFLWQPWIEPAPPSAEEIRAAMEGDSNAG